MKSEKCEYSNKTLSTYADGELNADRISAIKEHLKTCAFCQAEYESLKNPDIFISGFKEIEPSAYFNSKFWKKVDSFEESAAGMQWQWKLPLPIMAAVTSIIIVLFATFSLRVNALEPKYKSEIISIAKNNISLKGEMINLIALVNFCKRCTIHLCKCCEMKEGKCVEGMKCGTMEASLNKESNQ